MHNNRGQLEPFVRYTNISDDSTLNTICGSTQKPLTIQLDSNHSGWNRTVEVAQFPQYTRAAGGCLGKLRVI